MQKIHYLIIFLSLLAGFAFRAYHLEFGLPHSFYADEPEFTEPAIKYTYEIRNIIRNNDYYKLIPVSFVYGTFPVYLYTAATMLFSKSLNLLGLSFDKLHLFIYLRVVNMLISLILPLSLGALAAKIFKNSWVGVLGLGLAALNWKLIVHAHYVNADIVQTVLLTLSFLTLFLYYKREKDSLFTWLTGGLIGLAVGTKITTLITLPLYIYVFLIKKDFRGLAGLVMAALAVFMITNPFSFILSEQFAYRILSMFTKEAGLVLDSADLNPFKYGLALWHISTPLILAFSFFGAWTAIKAKENKHFHVFLILHIVTYLLFFSLQSRRVDRWLLPALPIIFLYAGFGLYEIRKRLNPGWVWAGLVLVVMGAYLYYPMLLLKQFARWTPKSEAYLWMRQNIDPLKRVLVYTEEGLDPLNKLPAAKVYKLPVYADENAQYFFPVPTEYFHYVVISSRPLENHKRLPVKQAYPFYYEKWKLFEEDLSDPEQFRLVNQFVLPKPNLIPLSDVLIYENLGEIKPLPPQLINNP